MKETFLTTTEKKVLLALIEGIPITSRPFLEIANRCGLSEEEVIDITKKLQDKGIIRRLGATLRHNLAGYEGNAMVVWQVPESRIIEVGKTLAQKHFISHCYVRKSYPEWPYNLYTMCHAKTKEELLNLIEKCAEEVNLFHYQILFTKREIRRKYAQYKIE